MWRKKKETKTPPQPDGEKKEFVPSYEYKYSKEQLENWDYQAQPDIDVEEYLAILEEEE